MTAHADDERHVELGAVGVVEAMKIGERRLVQAVKPGSGLLGGGVGGELTLTRRLAGEIGMAVDERALLFRASVAHGIRHRLIKRRQTRERPRGESLVRHPRRKLHHFAKRGIEGFTVGGVQRIERYLFHGAAAGAHVITGASAPRSRCSRCQCRAMSSRVAIQTRSNRAI